MNQEWRLFIGIEPDKLLNLPKNRKYTRCRWIYKIKYRANGEIEIYKVCIVAEGYN